MLMKDVSHAHRGRPRIIFAEVELVFAAPLAGRHHFEYEESTGANVVHGLPMELTRITSARLLKPGETRQPHRSSILLVQDALRAELPLLQGGLVPVRALAAHRVLEG